MVELLTLFKFDKSIYHRVQNDPGKLQQKNKIKTNFNKFTPVQELGGGRCQNWQLPKPTTTFKKVTSLYNNFQRNAMERLLLVPIPREPKFIIYIHYISRLSTYSKRPKT